LTDERIKEIHEVFEAQELDLDEADYFMMTIPADMVREMLTEIKRLRAKVESLEETLDDIGQNNIERGEYEGLDY
jgi:hypothetical protein